MASQELCALAPLHSPLHAKVECQEASLRGRAAVACVAHNHEVEGATPSPATSDKFDRGSFLETFLQKRVARQRRLCFFAEYFIE